MKIFKYIFLLLLIVIIGGAVYIATLDGDYQVEETKTLDAPASLLFNEVNNYENWETWGPWKKEDPNMVISYNEKTSGVGAGYSWQGDTAADGEISTTEVIPNRRIHQEVILKNPMGESKSDAYWIFEPIENGKTKVVWGVKGDKSFWEKAYGLTQSETITETWKPFLTNGLIDIDQIVSKKMEAYDIHVDGITQYSGGFYMYRTTATKNNGKALSKRREELLPSVTNFMSTNNINISGAPLMIYKEVDEQNNTAIISSGVPTNSRVITPLDSDILCGFMESQMVLKTTLKGNHSNLMEAWAAADEYIRTHNIEKREDGEAFEIYINQPQDYPNPADWVTEVYIPVQQKSDDVDPESIIKEENEIEI